MVEYDLSVHHRQYVVAVVFLAVFSFFNSRERHTTARDIAERDIAE